MAELFLKFVDETGEEREVSVEQEEFIIGRHSENDLSIINSKLSRQHLKIQRFGDVFVVTDLDSSNGTTINGEELEEPIALKDGDVLNLGGGLEIEIELDDPNAMDNSSDESDEAEEGSEKSASASAGSAGGGSAGNVSSVSSQSSGGGSGIGKALILAPVLGLLILFTAVGAMFIISGTGDKELAQTNNNDDGGFITTSSPDDDEDTPEPKDDGNENAVETPIPNDSPQTDNTNINNTAVPEDSPGSVPTNDNQPETPPVLDESDDIGKVRSNSFKFMRKIARGNQKSILLSNQLAILENKIRSFKNSRALANNIKNAQQNSSQIQALASSKNLKPQFLVTAALAKLGNSSGNVYKKAQEMADVLDSLQIQLNDENADDIFIIIAAYDQGVRGDTLKMRNTLQRLAKNHTRASEVRTIWFLKDRNAITEAQFEFALRFLAIGTITQNPKAFNVNANALVLN